MDPIILTVVIAGGVVFLFVLAGKLAWFVRKMEDVPRDGAAVQSDDALAAGQENPLDADNDNASRATPSD